MRVWPLCCSSQCLSQRIKLSAKYLKYSCENKCSLLNLWGCKVREVWDLKRRTFTDTNGRWSATGSEKPHWHHYTGFTSSQSQPGKSTLCAFLSPQHNKTAARFGRNSFHLVLSEAVTHQVKTLRVRKPMQLSQH